MEVSSGTAQLQSSSVTPGDPCDPTTSSREEVQQRVEEGDRTASEAAELHQAPAVEIEEESEDSDR